jgi:carboxymethylenebutenolidase
MEIRFQRPDGKESGGYLAEPAKAGDAPGVVILPEWWGVNEQIRGVADQLAQRGYRALVADLYQGRVTQDPEEAKALKAHLDVQAAVVQDTRGAVRHLKETAPGAKVAVLGFCMGARLAQIASVGVPEVDAVVSFYGNPSWGAADLTQAHAPLLLHFGTEDGSIPRELVEGVETQLREGGVPHELHWYEAQHAFANERRPEVYDAEATKLAWERTDAFLARVLR